MNSAQRIICTKNLVQIASLSRVDQSCPAIRSSAGASQTRMRNNVKCDQSGPGVFKQAPIMITSHQLKRLRRSLRRAPAERTVRDVRRFKEHRNFASSAS